MSFEKLKTISPTLGFRLTAWYVLLLVCSTVLVFFASYNIILSTVTRHDRENLLDELREYSEQYDDAGIESFKRQAAFETRADGTVSFLIRIIRSDGKVVFGNAEKQWAEYDLSGLKNQQDFSTRQILTLQGLHANSELEVAVGREADGTLLELARTTEDRKEILSAVERLFGLVIFPVIALSFFSGKFLADRALGPVRQLITVLQSTLTTGRFTARAPRSETGDELDALSSLFNTLLERISVLVAGMRNSFDAVAHDLRTPMTRFRGTAELALKSRDPEAMADALDNCVEESDRILTTLHILMDISEAESGAMKLNIQPASMGSIVSRAVSLYENVAEEKDIKVECQVPENLIAEVDGDRILQVFANLLDNALKYTPEHGKVEISAKHLVNAVEVTVKDTGIGVSKDELPNIFDRLYRGDRSRTEKGFGLGLSLVKAIVEAHHGWVDVKSDLDAGSSFCVHLPAASQ